MRLSCKLIFPVIVISFFVVAGCTSSETNEDSVINVSDITSSCEGITDKYPSTSEIEDLYAQGGQHVIWYIDDAAFGIAGDVTIWNTQKTDYLDLLYALYDSLFSDTTVIHREQATAVQYTTFSNGVTSALFEGYISLYVNNHDYALELEKAILSTLSFYTGMELQLYKKDRDQTTYAFLLNKIPLDTNGYGVERGGFVPGASLSSYENLVTKEYCFEIMIPYGHTTIAENYSADSFVAVDTIKTIIKEDLISQNTDQDVVLVLDNVDLMYFFQEKSKQFRPMWRISGQVYIDGHFYEYFRLIDVVTGELR